MLSVSNIDSENGRDGVRDSVACLLEDTLIYFQQQ